MADTKRVFIPNLHVKGSLLEVNGSIDDGAVYPGKSFGIVLTADDFEGEEYHTVWIAITKATQRKLAKEEAERIAYQNS